MVYLEMFTKTQAKIMQVFVSEINEKFSIKQISEIIKKPYALVHRSIKPLINERFILKDSKDLLSLNYKENHPELAYIESQRKKLFFEKHKSVFLFAKDVLRDIKLDFFIFLIFGSAAGKKSEGFQDIDILLIVQDKHKINEIENLLNNLSSDFSEKFDINVLSLESVYEMLSKRDSLNIMNETLNKHILIFGSESYYNLLKNGR